MKKVLFHTMGGCKHFWSNINTTKCIHNVIWNQTYPSITNVHTVISIFSLDSPGAVRSLWISSLSSAAQHALERYLRTCIVTKWALVISLLWKLFTFLTRLCCGGSHGILVTHSAKKESDHKVFTQTDRSNNIYSFSLTRVGQAGLIGKFF